jgi:hypothetical protein
MAYQQAFFRRVSRDQTNKITETITINNNPKLVNRIAVVMEVTVKPSQKITERLSQ